MPDIGSGSSGIGSGSLDQLYVTTVPIACLMLGSADCTPDGCSADLGGADCLPSGYSALQVEYSEILGGGYLEPEETWELVTVCCDSGCGPVVSPSCPEGLPTTLTLTVTTSAYPCLAGTYTLTWDGTYHSYSGSVCGTTVTFRYNPATSHLDIICDGQTLGFTITISACCPFAGSGANSPSTASTCWPTIGETVAVALAGAGGASSTCEVWVRYQWLVTPCADGEELCGPAPTECCVDGGDGTTLDCPVCPSGMPERLYLVISSPGCLLDGLSIPIWWDSLTGWRTRCNAADPFSAAGYPIAFGGGLLCSLSAYVSCESLLLGGLRLVTFDIIECPAASADCSGLCTGPATYCYNLVGPQTFAPIDCNAGDYGSVSLIAGGSVCLGTCDSCHGPFTVYLVA